MNEDQLARLVEANENLVLAMLKAQAQREADAKKLREISRSAELDALTRLPNRLLLTDRFCHAIASAKRRGDRVAVLFLDLNKFKEINDTLGHAAGDQVLKIAAHCLTECVRECDTVSRHGGDEFVILLEQISGVSDVQHIVGKILASLGTPNRVGPHLIRLTASVGISLYPDNGDDAKTLIALADSAMYKAKHLGNGSFVFSGETGAQLPDKNVTPPLVPFEISLAEKEQRRRCRRSADEQMIYATLTAQEHQAGAENALRRQTEFMAVLAHELRNPLGPIRNATMLIRQAHPATGGSARMHALIEKQVDHMAKLLDDVFDMSRIATGKMRIDHERINLVDVIRQSIEATHFSVAARRQELRSTLPDFPLEVLGDSVRLDQVFRNLLDNASKYTPEDKLITLDVESGEISLVVRVTDTGIGITAEALPNVFQMFAQDSHATRFNGKGLGIGLALVRELVEAHGGTVSAYSDGAGLGSQFAVTLPRASGLSGPS